MPDKMESNIDPLELVARHKDIVRHLRGNGIDGHEIYKLLCDMHDLYLPLPVTLSESDKEKWAESFKARRDISAVINYKVMTDDEKDCLRKMRTRLLQEYPPFDKDKRGREIIKRFFGNLGGDSKAYDVKYEHGYSVWEVERSHPEEKPATSEKQAWGRQVVAIHSYVMEFISNKNMFRQTDVFELIAELYDVLFGLQFTRDQIKNFYTNHPSNHK